jgi:hypothetical protein
MVCHTWFRVKSRRDACATPAAFPAFAFAQDLHQSSIPSFQWSPVFFRAHPTENTFWMTGGYIHSQVFQLPVHFATSIMEVLKPTMGGRRRQNTQEDPSWL